MGARESPRNRRNRGEGEKHSVILRTQILSYSREQDIERFKNQVIRIRKFIYVQERILALAN